MSERADDDVRGEQQQQQQQRRAARQLKQQPQFQRGEASTAMATVAERRSLPSPEIMLGQPWSSWVDAVKLYGSDGTELEESLKECGKNREAMRLCRDDMPIFGQCPAQDDFYLVMCSHCSQVVKPQAFQAHYERRHSSSSKPPSSYASPAFAISRNKSSVGGGAVSGSTLARTSSTNSSVPTKIYKPTKEKLPHRKPHFPYRVLQEESPIPAVKVDKVHLKESSAKIPHVPASSSTSSSSSNTVNASPLKSGLNFPSIPKAPQLAPGQIPNGKGHLSSQDKKTDSSSASSRRPLYKRQEREFNPDIHCGVLDMAAHKPCTRSLTCKTHSISQRRAVLGRRQRFDTLLAEHKSKARDKELHFRLDPSHPAPPLRDLTPSRLSQDPHPVSHGNGTADATKPLPLSKPKPHNSGLPRLNNSNSHSGGDPAVAHDQAHHQAHHSHSAPVGTESSRLSSDEGENEEREEATEKLDCHYSGYHPRPAAYCTFGSRLYGRGCYTFDRRWDQVRCVLTTMLDKHVNSQMWKKIPLALENSATTPTASHRTSTNSHSSSSSSISAGFLGLSSPPPYDSKPVLSYGTTLNARCSPQASATKQPAYSGASRQVSASSPQMPSAHLSSLPSLGSNRPLKSRSGTKSFRAREPSSSLSNSIVKGSNNSSVSVSGNASGSLSSGKKRKNSSLLTSHSTYTSESSSSFKKNCAVNVGSLGSAYHSSLASTPSSSSSSSSSASSTSHSGVYSVGVNCTPGRANSLSLKQESTGRGPPSGSPAESIKRMSVVMNSSDSTLSLGPFVHQSSDHHADARLEAKRRKGSPGSSSLNSTASGAGGGGQGPGRPKMAKSPSINNIHSKHARSIPGPPGLPNNSLIHQPKARP